jgi:hypothetical protein
MEVAGETILPLYVSQDEDVGESETLSLEVPTKEASQCKSSVRLFNAGYETGTTMDTRVRTAPARRRTELEKFRGSSLFRSLEGAAISAGQLLQRQDGKFDLESTEGQKNSIKLLECVESLCVGLEVSGAPRTYRAKFTAAYKVLYKEGSLCYLPEILDSAQESMELDASCL